jgi:hypothetical protein
MRVGFELKQLSATGSRGYPPSYAIFRDGLRAPADVLAQSLVTRVIRERLVDVDERHDDGSISYRVVERRRFTTSPEK